MKTIKELQDEAEKLFLEQFAKTKRPENTLVCRGVRVGFVIDFIKSQMEDSYDLGRTSINLEEFKTEGSKAWKGKNANEWINIIRDNSNE